MRADPRIVDPHLNWGEKMPSLHLEVDQARARAFGLTPQNIAQSLQTLIGGVTVTTLRADDERDRCRGPRGARGTRRARSRRRSHDRQRAGGAVPVGQIARVVRTSEEPILWRRDRESS